MKTDVLDRRVQRTQRVLARALIDLTLAKGYEALTIRDITEQAEVGYATFFRHYADKDALLADVSDVVLADLLHLLAQPQLDGDPVLVGTLVFQYVQDHSELCRVFLSSRGSPALVRRMVETSTRIMLAEHLPLPGSVVPPEIAAHHLVTASIALIQWWLDHDLPLPPERMGIIYAALIAHPTHAVAFQTKG